MTSTQCLHHVPQKSTRTIRPRRLRYSQGRPSKSLSAKLSNCRPVRTQEGTRVLRGGIVCEKPSSPRDGPTRLPGILAIGGAVAKSRFAAMSSGRTEPGEVDDLGGFAGDGFTSWSPVRIGLPISTGRWGGIELDGFEFS